MKILVGNRNISGNNDGPEEVLRQFLNTDQFIYLNVNKIYNNFHGIKCFDIKYNFKLMQFLKKYPKGTEFIFFPLHTVPIFSSIFLRKRFPHSVIGYDSFYRNYLLLFKRRRGFKNIFKNVLCTIYFFLVELLVSLYFEKIYFVSRKCRVFFNKVFSSKIGCDFPINKFEITSPKSLVNWKRDNVTILGPFKSDYDKTDLEITLQKLNKIGVADNKISLLGREANKVISSRVFLNRIDWVNNYDEYLKEMPGIFFLNRTAGSGVPTKAQKVIRLGKILFVHRGIDVGKGYINFARYF